MFSKKNQFKGSKPSNRARCILGGQGCGVCGKEYGSGKGKACGEGKGFWWGCKGGGLGGVCEDEVLKKGLNNMIVEITRWDKGSGGKGCVIVNE